MGAFAAWNLRVGGDGPFGPWTVLGVGMLGLYVGTLLLGFAAPKSRAQRRWSALLLAVALLPLLLSVPVLLPSWSGLFSNTAGHPGFGFSRVVGKALLLLIGLSWAVLGCVVWSEGASGRARANGATS